MNRIEFEEIAFLPERVETSDYNWSAVGISQGNAGIQVALGSVQLLGQGNLALVGVHQTNF